MILLTLYSLSLYLAQLYLVSGSCMSEVKDRTMTREHVNVKATDFVFYTVTDITVSVAFYRDTLGLELELLSDDGESGYAEFAVPPTTLGLSEADPQGEFSPGGDGAGIALAVDDVETATEELRNDGIPIHMDPLDTGVCHMSTIADPDGNPIMLHKRNDGTHGRIDPFP